MVIDDCSRNLRPMSNSSLGHTTADVEKMARVRNRCPPLDNFGRLLQLRLQETDYTDEELVFLYQMHNQEYYKRENLQNPKSVEEC